MLKQIIKLGGILFIITFSVIVILAAVNDATKDIIIENTHKAENEARAELIEADEFVLVEEDVYRAVKDGETVGYTVSEDTAGYGGVISMIVGIKTDGSVAGIRIVTHSETPGLGSRVADDNFIAEFANEVTPITVKKGGGAEQGEVNAISGATVSCNAVARGVNNAAKKLDDLGLIKRGEV